ncbi:MAG: hypothetical protein ACI4PI_01840 [Oscillospiraceae bacterium]
MKNKGTFLASLVLSLGVIFSSCQISNSTQYAETYSGGTIPTGVYVLYSLQEARDKVFEEISQTDPELLQNSEDIYSINFNGKLIEDLIVERAKTEMQMHVGADKLFEELKLNLKDEQKNFLKQEENVYKENEEAIKAFGIEKESYISYAENIQKRQALFDYYYGENGKNRPKEEQLKKYFDSNYLKLSRRPFRYGSEEDKEKSKEKAQKFLDSVRDNGFEEAWRLEEEGEKEGKEAAKKEVEKTAEGNKIEEAGDSRESVEDESSKVDADEKSEEVEKEETPEEARDRIKNSNTNIIKKSMLKGAFKQKEIDKIDSADIETPVLVDSVSNKAWFVVVKQKTDEQEFENIKANVLYDMCETPFEKILVDKGKTMNINFNETAISEFSPSKVQKKEKMINN